VEGGENEGGGVEKPLIVCADLMRVKRQGRGETTRRHGIPILHVHPCIPGP